MPPPPTPPPTEPEPEQPQDLKVKLQTTVKRPTSRLDFEIAIICALQIESDAVEACFDQFWDDTNQHQYGKAPGDSNSYALGRIGHHNVVLVYLSGIGTAIAAGAAASLRTSFPNIRLGLVVGVCGGVPQPKHYEQQIYLGDVIISTSIVQYDKFVEMDTPDEKLGRPSYRVRAFLRQIQGWEARRRLQNAFAANALALCRKKGFGSWHRPLPEEDRLFPSTYRHKHRDPKVCEVCRKCVGPEDPVCDRARSASCKEMACDMNIAITRHREVDGEEKDGSEITSAEVQFPEVHFGKIASGDLVIKSALHRDRIAAAEEVIGYEMEGAGVWDNFPTIVVKGVCDYADSHKNKRWQKYACIVAAACASAMLREWRGSDKSTVSGGSNATVQPSIPQTADIPTHDNATNSFINHAAVHSQAATQIFNGPIYHGPVYYYSTAPNDAVRGIQTGSEAHVFDG